MDRFRSDPACSSSQILTVWRVCLDDRSFSDEALAGLVRRCEAAGTVTNVNLHGSGVTASLFAVVHNPDAHYARSVAAGFEILLPLRDEAYGSREYRVRDPEGHIWTFAEPIKVVAAADWDKEMNFKTWERDKG